jgi:hypothetical protein
MPENNHQTNVLDPIFQPMLEYWTKAIEQSQEHAKVLLDSMREAGDLKTLRRRWLDALAQSLDLYMRTPAFLEGMHQHLDLMTGLKGHAEEAGHEVAQVTGIPRMPDISGLFERVRIGHDAILARLDAIDRKLEVLQKRRKRPGTRRGSEH